MSLRPLFGIALLLLNFTTAIRADESILTATAYLRGNGVHAGEQFQIALVVKLFDDWHINAHQPHDDFTIPTNVLIPDDKNFSIQAIEFPQPVRKRLAFAPEPLAVFEKEVLIHITGRLSPSVTDSLVLKGALTFQGCNDRVCLPPDTVEFKMTIPVLPPDQPVIFQNEAYFASISQSSESKAATGFDLRRSVAEKGYFLTFLLIFIGGLGLTLTPCVYPLIPITVSFFGGQQGWRLRQRLIAALIFVLGMALVNSLLGTLAALSGALVGSLLANPLVLIILALIMLGLSLAMFGVYEFRLPNFLMNLSGVARTGYLGSFLMGLTMGIVAAPCIGPFVLGLLTYVATVGKAWFGFLVFFTLSLGLGLPFIVLALFAGSIQNLPRSGEWMVGVRRIFGLVLVGMALYFLKPLVPVNLKTYIFPAYFLAAGLYLLLFERAGSSSKIFTLIKNLLGILAVVTGVWLLKPGESPSSSMAWQPFTLSAYEQALQSDKLIILDFYADWCIPCKELDKFTFTDAAVIALSKNFVLFKVDLTSGGNTESRALQMQFEVRGVPTLIFIGRDGKELTGLRVVGFEKPQAFSARMQKALE